MGKAVSDTIRHIVEVTGNPNQTPYMNLSLRYINTLVLFPNEQDLILLYNLFMTKLVDKFQNFNVLQMAKIRDYPPKTIHINITDEYISQAMVAVGENIIKLYEPVQKYMFSLEQGYREVFTAVSLSSIHSETEFDGGISHLRHVQTYINKTSSLLTSEYFAVGQLILSEYIQTMKESLSEVIENIFSSLCGILIAENENICECFEKIKAEALRKPKTSEELIEQGKYFLLLLILFKTLFSFQYYFFLRVWLLFYWSL